MGGALARCVGDPERFEREIWGRRHEIRRGDDPAAFADVFGVDALDAFVTDAVRRPLVRVVDRGEPLPETAYTARVRLGGHDFRDVVDPDQLARLFHGGATVVAQSLHRTEAGVRAFTTELGDEISHPVQANAYLSPSGSAGLARHADLHDVVVIQLSGSKRWWLGDDEPFELHAGDTMYLPAGLEHRAAATDTSSLHLTIGILRVTYRQVVARLLAQGVDELDRPLPLRYRTHADATDPSLEVGLAEAIRAAGEHLGRLDASAVARQESARPPLRRPRPGSLSSAIAVSDIVLDTCLRRGDDPWEITVDDDRAHVVTTRRRFDAPAAVEPALRRLADDTWSAVGDLPGLDEASRIVVARRLVREGLCRIVPPGHTPG